ncbi:IS5 family transposase [Teichococcus aestuarii]|uniref:IS5/IS1182 family transposase n=1 Tax=Teichococcus aestuarii TaxID=568898 RepID=A0A2U1UYW8_9PROT|nr:IS5 family transposase [Pseudoroseomonas aestuarii]PWC26791.1 IS5/IS1182 family transposase [Pseudoroseomonas aestuarii]
MAGQPGFFDVDERYAALSAAGDPLERLAAVVDFEIFRPVLDAALARSDRSRGGRPPYDAVLMFRVLVLQALYSLSDEQAEFQLRDRLSFMRFAGLGLHQTVPDAKTIWLYREQLKQAGAIEALFRRFDEVLVSKGYLAMGGQIIDATIIAAPRQKLTLEEKATIREGGTPEGWSRAKRAQKDQDARWTLKRGRTKPKSEGHQRQAIQIAVPVFGYKSHIGIDRRHGLIRRWAVTDAAQHDSRSFDGLLDPENTASRVWADTAYRTKRNLEVLERRGLSERIQFRRPPRRPLSELQAKANATRARIRSGIEHVFAAQKHRMALFVRTIGLARAQVKIGMANLAYNFTRLAWLSTRVAPA